ncbi:MAG: hypothetical protein GX444_11620 [Myxococcales bacterium]|nr:hypothetical protein [Myxococcales bacterium]
MLSFLYLASLLILWLNTGWLVCNLSLAPVYERQLQLHTVIGSLFALLTLLYLLFALWRFHSKLLTISFLAYPLLMIWSLLAPVPLLLVFFVNISVLPLILFYLVFTRGPVHRDAMLTRWWCLAHYFLLLVVITGIYSTLNPVALRFAFFYRKIHSLFAFGLFFFGGYYLLLLSSRLFFPTRWRHAYYLPALILCAATGLAFYSFTEAKQHLIQASLDRHQYVTEPLAKKENLIFRNLPPATLEKSIECKKCHEVPYRQWVVSVHAYAAKNLPFQRTAQALAAKHGTEILRHCAVCHDPAVSFNENPGLLIDPEHVRQSEGVSCRACHLMRRANDKNGEYAVSLPRVDRLYQDSDQRQAYMLRSVLEHVQDFAPPITKDGSGCFPCHSLESTRNGHLHIPLDNVSSYRASSFAKTFPCQSCHMPRLERDEYQYTWQDHRMFGIHYLLPKTALETEATQQEQLVLFADNQKLWLRSELVPLYQLSTFLDETLKAYRVNNYARTLNKIRGLDNLVGDKKGHFLFNLTTMVWDRSAQPWRLRLGLTAASRNVAHDFPSSLFANITRSWLALEIRDNLGREIWKSGSPDVPDHQLGRLEVDATGNWIEPMDSLSYVDIINRKWISPDHPYLDEYNIEIPPDVAFPLQATYSLYYLRYTDRFMTWITDDPANRIEPLVLQQTVFPIPFPQP